MEKHYKEIQHYFGDIDGALKKLTECKKNGELAFIEFNGKKLYSDIDDLDSAYIKVTGKTKADFEEEQRKWKADYDEKLRKHTEAIPQLTIKWIEKGKKILDKKYHDKWIQCVPIRLSDLYRGMELWATLQIVKKLNNRCRLETAEKIIKNQGHSGMSYGLVCSMVRSFCDRGNEFVTFIDQARHYAKNNLNGKG